MTASMSVSVSVVRVEWRRMDRDSGHYRPFEAMEMTRCCSQRSCFGNGARARGRRLIDQAKVKSDVDPLIGVGKISS